MDWEVVYQSCFKDPAYFSELEASLKEKREPVIPNEALYFPERLTPQFLAQALRTMGSFKFANQYLNQVIPIGANPLKKEWLRYYEDIPKNHYTFCMIDPAISQSEDADFTAIVVVDVDCRGNWYIKLANRYRITPTEIVNKIFEIQTMFSPMIIGIEDVAFQKALLYMVTEEIIRRGQSVPVQGVRPDTDKSKHTRIMGLVPRFEWGRIFIGRGLHDFELEYCQYVGERSSHDDLLDALAHVEKLIGNTYPNQEIVKYDQLSPSHPDYEKYFIQRLHKRASQGNED